MFAAALRARSKAFLPRTTVRATHSHVAREIETRGPWVLTQDISPTDVRKLDATLTGHLPDIQLAAAANSGPNIAVPPGYHLLFFNDVSPEVELGPDGYHQAQAPDAASFPLRMWLGGVVEYDHTHAPLATGTVASAIETIARTDHRVTHSDSGAAQERIDVSVDRYLYAHDVSAQDPATTIAGTPWAIKETRSIAYFSPASGSARSSAFDRIIRPRYSASPAYSQPLTPSMVTLFRYSALTFNSHRVHYDPRYCADVEGLPAPLVHGPFSMTLALAWLHSSVLPKINKHAAKEWKIKRYSYRNLLPLFVDQQLTLHAMPLDEKTNSFDVWIENHRGSQCTRGTIQLE